MNCVHKTKETEYDYDNSQFVYFFENRYVIVLRGMEQTKQIGDNKRRGNVIVD